MLRDEVYAAATPSSELGAAQSDASRNEWNGATVRNCARYTALFGVHDQRSEAERMLISGVSTNVVQCRSVRAPNLGARRTRRSEETPLPRRATRSGGRTRFVGLAPRPRRVLRNQSAAPIVNASATSRPTMPTSQ